MEVDDSAIYHDDLPAKIPETGPHLIRIKDGGKIRDWVSLALQFLKKTEDRPVVFHTLSPTTPKLRQTGGINKNAQETESPHNNATMARHKVTWNVPRLISVVEIVKREFLKSLEGEHSPRLVGLHQYNEIGHLEAAVEPATETSSQEDRANVIIEALDGRKYVQQEQTPYMRITLSLCALPDLVGKGATYQPPVIRQLSKSARSRRKGRERLLKAKERPAQAQTSASFVA